MAVPTSFTGLSTTPGSNSPVAGDNVFPDLDDFLRIMQAMLASIYANTATNGWVSPYLPLAGGTLTGALAGVTNLTATGNTVLGDATADTLSVGGAVVKNADGDWLFTSISVTAPTNAISATFTGPIKVAPYTVATLPSGAAAASGARAFVTDATVTTFASVVVGGGANGVPVYHDGTDWRIG